MEIEAPSRPIHFHARSLIKIEPSPEILPRHLVEGRGRNFREELTCTDLLARADPGSEMIFHAYFRYELTGTNLLTWVDRVSKMNLYGPSLFLANWVGQEPGTKFGPGRNSADQTRPGRKFCLPGWAGCSWMARDGRERAGPAVGD